MGTLTLREMGFVIIEICESYSDPPTINFESAPGPTIYFGSEK